MSWVNLIALFKQRSKPINTAHYSYQKNHNAINVLVLISCVQVKLYIMPVAQRAASRLVLLGCS
jgi:hypothetical protein